MFDRSPCFFGGLFVVAVTSACAPGGPDVPPQVTAQDRLRLELERDLALPLQVISTAPEGTLDDTNLQIHVVFSKPLRSLSLAEEEQKPGIAIDPPLAGAFHWVGTNALTFTPTEGAVRSATAYQVTIPAATRASDGTLLEHAVTFAFETPRPRVLDIGVLEPDSQLLPTSKFYVDTNLPVLPKALHEALEVVSSSKQTPADTVAQKKRVEVDISRGKNPQRLILTPRSPLPLDSKIELVVHGRLMSEVGPLAGVEPYRLELDTYGPLSASLQCFPDLNSCSGRPALVFNNPTKAKELRGVTISPEAGRTLLPVEVDDDGYDFPLGGRYERNQQYVVRLDGGIRDVFGQSLGKDVEFRFRMGEPSSMIQLGATIGFVEPRLGDEVVISSVNVGAFEELTTALTPEQTVRYWEDGLSAIPVAKRRWINPQPGFNRQRDHAVSFQQVLGKPHGAMLVGYSIPAREGGAEQSELTLVHSTDLAVTSRVSSRGGLAWVTSLTTGKPVANAAVRLMDVPGASGRKFTTGADGLVVLPAEEFRNVPTETQRAGAVVVETADDWAYGFVRDVPEYQHVDLVKVFTDRGIYRPGDPVYVKGWLRRETEVGTTPRVEAKVRVRLTQFEREVHQAEATSNAYGGFAVELRIPSHAALGEYEVSVEADGVQRGREILRVGEYRSSEFLVDVDIPKREYTRGETITADISGQYLFGGPMPQAGLHVMGTASEGYFQPRGTEGFQTDAWQYSSELRLLLGQSPVPGEEVSALLDEMGRRTLDFPSKVQTFGPLTYTVSASVSDESRQTVAGVDNTLVHPGDFYVGVSTAGWKRTRELEPNVIAVSKTGERLPGKAVEVELYERPRQPEERARKLASCKVTTAVAPVSCRLKVNPDVRSFVLVRAKDTASNALFAAAPVGGYTRGYHPVDIGETLALDIQPDKESYQTGDVARVLVRTAEARQPVLLTLEQDGILWHGQGTSENHRAWFDVPIGERIVRNAYLVAHATTGGKAKRPEKDMDWMRPEGSAPAVETTSVGIEIDQSSKGLRVEVLPERDVAKPGASVKVQLQVNDHTGKPSAAEVALFAVDEGVLMLTGYTTPDPFEAFTPFRDHAVSFQDSREWMGWLYRPSLEEQVMQGFGYGAGRLGGSHTSRAPKVRMGQVSISPSSEARADFATTPYFQPSIPVGDDGRVEVTVKLSELTTRYRLMAVASARGDRFGSGQSFIETRLPLMVRPALPRFSRVGDRFKAGVLVSSTSSESERVKVSVRARGVRLEGPAEQTIELSGGATRQVRFGFLSEALGNAEFEFSIEGTRNRDSVKASLPISVPLSPQAVALYGKTTTASGERLDDLSAASPSYGELDVALSSTALVGLDDGIDQLIEYPYGCTEQLSSRLLPMLPLRDLAKDFGIALPDDVDGSVRSTISEILTRQRYDGGFGLWVEDRDSHPWLTAYVFRVLDEAKKRGADVPDDALARAHTYLFDYATSDQGSELDRPTLAFIAYVMAEHGTPSEVLAERLMKDDDGDPAFVRALSLQAMLRVRADRPVGENGAARDPDWAKRVDRHISGLVDSLEADLRITGNRAFIDVPREHWYHQLFDSETRTNAMVLSALLEADPKHPMAERLARGLLAARRGGTWRSTQETAYALLALDSYRHRQETESPDFGATVWLGETALHKSEHRSRSLAVQGLSVPMAKLPRQGDLLAFQKDGRGTLFYQALLRYSPLELPVVPLDHGFYVESRLYRATRGPEPEAVSRGYAPGEVTFRAGEVVMGDVSVTSPVQRDFVVVEVPLPAGLEAIDVTLETQSGLGYSDADAGPGQSEWHRRELRDDRVLYFLNQMPRGTHRFRYLARATTSGTFVTPPSRASEMYSPETFGRTGGGTIVVE
jgi:alpha-2-macroglobulin